MICSMCGQVLFKSTTGNIIDYRHSGTRMSDKCQSHLALILHADVKKGIMVAR